jgi:hypothetical protein
MTQYYKIAFVLTRLVSLLVVLLKVYGILGLIIIPFLLGGSPAMPPFNVLVDIVSPLPFAILLWFGAHPLAKLVSRGVD